MLTKRNFVVILLTLSYEPCASDYNNFEEFINEGSPCEVKISAALAVLKNENSRKLDVLAKNIPDTIEKYLENKLSILLENNNHAIQEGIYQQFHKLEKNILDKMEQYVDDKFNYLEKHLDRKIDTLEKIVSDEINTKIINYKLNSLKNIQLDLSNETSMKIVENLNNKLNIIEKTMTILENNTTNCNFDALNKNLTNLEDKLDHKWTELKKMVPKLEENIELKLDTLYKKVPIHFEDIVNLKLDKMDKNMFSLKDNILRRLDTFEKQLEVSIEHKLEEIEKTIPELKQNMNNRIDTLQNIEKNIYAEIYQTRYTLGCKEQRIINQFYVAPYHQIGDEALKHIYFKYDSAGLSNFEMHFAVKCEDYMYILLSSSSESVIMTEQDVVYDIGILSDFVHLYHMRKIVVSKQIPKTFSSTRFTAFYIKINNGTLELGKEGISRTPLLTYSDAGLKTVKYFSYSASAEKETTLLYDCPSNVFQRLFDEP